MKLDSTGPDVMRWQQALIVRRRASMLTIGNWNPNNRDSEI